MPFGKLSCEIPVKVRMASWDNFFSEIDILEQVPIHKRMVRISFGMSNKHPERDKNSIRISSMPNFFLKIMSNQTFGDAGYSPVQ